MKGSATSLGLRVRVLIAFAAAFLAGATAIFAIAALAGVALHAAGVSLTWRMSIAAAIFIALAALDVRAIRRKDYCPIGMRRQTPQTLGRHYGPALSAAVWGFDTGLVVTTFRVAAITWAALALPALGLAPWWIGIAYGIGFTAPLLVLLVAHDADSQSLHRALRARPLLQSCSAIALVAGAVYLIAI